MGKAGHGRRPLRVLLAEDELLVAADIEATLLEIGCEVVGPVATVEEVERIARHEALDGAIVDINLRGTSVFGVLAGLVERRIPVILSSGYEDRSLYPDEFRHLPMLSKPYGAADLESAVRTVFGSRNPT